MIKFISAALTTLLCVSNLYAQETPVTKIERSKNGQTYAEYSIQLPTKDLKQIQEDWYKFLKFEGQASKINVSDNQEYTALSASNIMYFINPVHIFSNLSLTEDGVVLNAYFMRTTDSVYVDFNINEDKNVRFKNFLRAFGMRQQERLVDEKKANQKENLKQAQANLKTFQKEEKKKQSAVKKMQRKNTKLNKKIEDLQREQELKQAQIDQQMLRVEEAATFTKTEHKAAKKVLKSYEKDFEKLQKKIDKLNSEIDDNSKEINEKQKMIKAEEANKKLLLQQVELQQSKQINKK